jgi:hypothetical protein
MVALSRGSVEKLTDFHQLPPHDLELEERELPLPPPVYSPRLEPPNYIALRVSSPTKFIKATQTQAKQKRYRQKAWFFVTLAVILLVVVPLGIFGAVMHYTHKKDCRKMPDVIFDSEPGGGETICT